MESSADYQKPCQRNFLSGKLLTPRGWKRRHRVRRLKNSLSLKVPERRFPEKREKSCWQAWGMSVKASLAAWNSGASKSLHKKFFEDFQKSCWQSGDKRACLRTPQKTAGVKNSFSGSLTSEERVERELWDSDFCQAEIFVQIWTGEFDSGSDWTLAACLTHASRTWKSFGTSKVAHGWVTRG